MMRALIVAMSLGWSGAALAEPLDPVQQQLCARNLDFSAGSGYAEQLQSLAATLREEVAGGDEEGTRSREGALRQRFQSLVLAYAGYEKAIFSQLMWTDEPARVYLRQRLGQDYTTGYHPGNAPSLFGGTAAPYGDYQNQAAHLDRAAAKWRALLGSAAGANAATADYCRTLRTPSASENTPAEQPSSAARNQAGQGGTTGASSESSIDQAALNEARLAEMRAERERAEQESMERISEAASQLDTEGQEILATMLFGAAVGIVGYGTVSGDVDMIGISSGVTLWGTAFGNGLSMIGLGEAEGRKCTMKQCILGRDPAYGAPLTVRFGTGVALPSVSSEDIRSVQALEGGMYPGIVSGVTARVFPVRLSIEAARYSGSFAPVAGGDPKKSIAWGLTAGAGVQLFGGGLLSPWGEARLSTLPNCRDEGLMTSGRVVDCSGVDMYKVGAGGGGYQAHWAVGNTFSLRSFWASGGAGQTNRTSLALDVSYQVNAPSGTGPRVALGGEFCAQCR